MRLPNSELAVVQLRKLSKYCLNPNHPLGKHKAAQFKQKLGLTQKDAPILKQNILNGLKIADAEVRYEDKFGTRFKVDMNIHIKDKSAAVTTIWIIPRSGNIPRLVTCYIKT
jgi:hypothetical protein